MAKKITAKQKREEKKRLNKQKWAKNDSVIIVPETKEEIKTGEIQDNNRKRSRQKSQAKAMGLKAVLSFDNKIAIASFVSSKNAKSSHIERITDKEGTTISVNSKMFESSVNKRDINIEKRITIEEPQQDGTIKKEEKGVKSTTCNPYFKVGGKDYIGIKEIAEEHFFGRAFPNENLRVQIAYNIFDVQKILGTFVNNIIYSFYNLSRDEVQSDNDVIGMLYSISDYDRQKETETFLQAKSLLKQTEAYYAYFDDVFKKNKKPDKNKEGDNSKQYQENLRHNFNILRVLSFLRQICMHAEVHVSDDEGCARTQNYTDSLEALFNISKAFGKKMPELKTLIDNIYSKGINAINDEFVKNGKNNLYILSKVYPNEKREVLLREYYNFVVCKEGSNIGISTRKLKETMIAQNMPSLKEENTYRNKLYTVMNFILVRELKNCATIREQMIKELRANMDEEEGRDRIYSKYAKEIYLYVKDKLKLMLNVFKEEAEGIIIPGKEDPVKFSHGKLDKKEIESFCLTTKNTEDITKVIYFLCKFLDGKEINELCCAMINKLDGISDLIETAKQCGEDVEFVDQFKCLSKCATMSNQIRIVKNISRMKKEMTIDNDTIFLDALELLGRKIEKYQKDKNGDYVKDEKGKKVYTKDYNNFQDMFFEGKNHRVRNFVSNNVIKSKWFSYVVRYNKPAECQALMRNSKLVKFALDELPDSQIEKYYISVFGEKSSSSNEEMRRELLKKLCDFSVRGFLDEIVLLSEDEMKQKDKFSEKEKKKSLIRLYLTIVYLITKSMVKINTRFSIACATYERDYILLCQSEKAERAWEKGATAFALTRKFLNHDKPTFEQYYTREREISAMPQEKRKELRKENDQLLKKTHYSKHAYCYIVDNVNNLTGAVANDNGRGLPCLSEKNDNANLFLEMRNKIVHLNVVHDMVKYINEIKNITSYYAFFCYVLQRMIIGNNSNEQNKFKAKYSKTLQEFGTYSKDLMWVLNLPFAYNLPRYKNLSNEQLFYDEEERMEKIVGRKNDSR